MSLEKFYSGKFEHLKVEIIDNHQLWLTLNNPEQMNAISSPMIQSLVSVIKAADFDPSIRVIVLTGAGKSFCAGGDIKAMEEKSGMFEGESFELSKRYAYGIQEIPKAIESLSTPIIAMVNGAAVGAGCDLAMMCDLRVGSGSSKFLESFTRMGLVPGDGGTFFLQRVVGYSKAMQMFLTSEVFEGKKAYDFGLLNFIFEDSLMLSETKKLATKIAMESSPIAQALMKKSMKHAYLSDLQSTLDQLSFLQGISQRTDDHFEALKAFKEKRLPNFSGK